ncbi:hypothetical protein ACHAXN_011354 [Cyclotella atomus]|jgi:uncharacterized coiled-coil DUF342 family protein
MKTITFLLLHIIAISSAFCPHHHHTHQPQKSRIHPPKSPPHLTTESDVIALVEKAEQLWAQAYQARQSANELSEKAESLGVTAEKSAWEAREELLTSVSLAKIGEAQLAQNLSLDLGALLKEVEEAQDRADEIERRAEEALKASEDALEQHLIDFPENA